MTAIEVINGLTELMTRHEKDTYNSFETRWIDVIKDCKSVIENLYTENKGLKRQIDEYKKEYHNDNKELDVVTYDMSDPDDINI